MANPILYANTSLCTRSRHRRSSCDLCAERCPTRAVTLTPSLRVSAAACTGCGVCAIYCPAGALEAGSPDDDELAAQVRALMQTGAAVTFACQESAPGRSQEGVCVVRCLGRLDEALLALAAAGGGAPRLVAGDCQNCPSSGGQRTGDLSARRATAILAAMGIPVQMAIEHEPAPPRPPAKATPAVSRRGFFNILALRTAGTAAALAGSVLQTGAPAPEGQAARGGPLPARLPAKRRLLLETLRSFGRPPVQALDCQQTAGMWAQVSISGSCTFCGMCAYFCPTGALTQIEEGEKKGIAFRVADCTNCRLCKDICYRSAVDLSPEVDLAKIVAGTVEALALGRPPEPGAFARHD